MLDALPQAIRCYAAAAGTTGLLMAFWVLLLNFRSHAIESRVSVALLGTGVSHAADISSGGPTLLHWLDAALAAHVHTFHYFIIIIIIPTLKNRFIICCKQICSEQHTLQLVTCNKWRLSLTRK